MSLLLACIGASAVSAGDLESAELGPEQVSGFTI
jgi:hypothetical protein